MRWGRGDVDPYGCKEDLKKISYVIGLGVNNRGVLVLMFLISWIEGERERGGERACERKRGPETQKESKRGRETHTLWY